MTQENKTTEAQRRANEKWKAENREKQRLYVMRSQARRFVNEFADKKDLEELKELIKEREKNLKNN